MIDTPSAGTKDPFVPRKYTLRERGLAKPFAVADFETILDQDGNHRVVTAGYRYYPSGSQGKPRTFSFSLDPKKLNEKNLAEESQLFVADFIQALEKFIHKKGQQLQSKAARARGEDPKPMVTYFHNLGTFDGIFLLESLQKNPELGAFEPILRNGRIYQIRMDFVIYRDSYLLLPASLNELGLNFLNEGKTELPLVESTLQAYSEKRGDLKTYMERDLKILGDVVKDFQNEIRNDFHLDIGMSLSLSGLSYQIYRANFMREGTIHISTGDEKLQKFLQEAYLGGFTEVYKPRPRGRVYAYDVNSAYPYAMAKNPLPTGKPTFIEHIIEESFQDFFGFIEASVNVKANTYIPPLVVREESEGSLISHTGLVHGVFFSEELRQAIDDGSAEVLVFHKGYAYRRGILFDGFVRSMYRRRGLAEVKGEKGKAFLYKRLLNSLYGRFAMKNTGTVTKILKNEDLERLQHFQSISNPRPLEGTNSTLVSLHSFFEEPSLDKNPTEEFLRNWEEIQKISLGSFVATEAFFIATQISAATTAYARMQIYQVKKQLLSEGYELYYSDTDSVYIDKPLPEDHPLLGAGLGKLKLEGNYEKALFLATKVYILVQDGKEKIVWKGLPNSVRESLSFDDFLEAWRGGPSFTEEYETPFKHKLKSLTVSKEVFTYTASFNYKKREKVYEKNEAGEQIWVDTAPRYFKNLAETRSQTQLEGIHDQVKKVKEGLGEIAFEPELSLPFDAFSLYLRALNFGILQEKLDGAYFHIHPILTDSTGESHYLGSSFQIRKETDAANFLKANGGILKAYEATTSRGIFLDSVKVCFLFFSEEKKKELLLYAHALRKVLMETENLSYLGLLKGEKPPTNSLPSPAETSFLSRLRSSLKENLRDYFSDLETFLRGKAFISVQKKVQARILKWLGPKPKD